MTAYRLAATGGAIVIPCNINEKDSLQNLVNEAREKLGQIDVPRLQCSP